MAAGKTVWDPAVDKARIKKLVTDRKKEFKYRDTYGYIDIERVRLRLEK